MMHEILNNKITFSLPSIWLVNAYTIALGIIIGFHKSIYDWTQTDWIIVLSPFLIEICLGISILFVFILVLLVKAILRN
jgi:hypothetical protein